MNKRTILIGILIAIMLIATVPLHAQDDDNDAQLIATVVEAYANLNNLDSYGFRSFQDETQVISSGVGVRQVSLHRGTARNITEGSYNAGDIEATVQQTDSIYVNGEIESAIDFTLSLHMITVSDNVFVEVTDVSGTLVSELSEADTEIIDESFPTGWILLSGEAAPENNILPPETLANALAVINRDNSPSLELDSLDLNSLLQLSNNFQVTEGMIVSIRQAAPNTDDESLDESDDDFIIVVELDATQVFASLGLEDTFDAEALAGDADALLQEIIDGMTITQRIRIVEEGSDPVMVYPEQVVTTMIIGTELTDSDDIIPIEFSETNTDDVPLAFSMSLRSRTIYTDFNSADPVETPVNEIEEPTEAGDTTDSSSSGSETSNDSTSTDSIDRGEEPAQ